MISKNAEKLIDWIVNEMKNTINPIELLIRRTTGFEIDTRKDERQKIADEIRELNLSDITTSETIYNAILDGGK